MEEYIFIAENGSAIVRTNSEFILKVAYNDDYSEWFIGLYNFDGKLIHQLLTDYEGNTSYLHKVLKEIIYYIKTDKGHSPLIIDIRTLLGRI